MGLEKTRLKIGFVALVDAAPLLVAEARGFFAEQGLSVELARQASWASLRDRLAVGALDAAQMLAPMPLAATLGLGGLSEPMVAAMALNIGGNAITLAASLMAKLHALDPEAAASRPLPAGLLARALRMDHGKKPVFAVVHPFSSHHYELRLWLESGGMAIDRDIHLTVVPPAQMLSNLSAGLIDGYCVGEPWNQLAASAGLGMVALTSRDLWAGRVEKILGVRQSWADLNPETHRALLRALLRAAEWADQPDHRGDLAELLSRPGHVNAPRALLRQILDAPNRPIFFRQAAFFPWRSQACWYLAQMRRARQIGGVIDAPRIIDQVFRCDLTRLACLDLGLPVPLIDSKIEGAHDADWSLTQATQPIAMGADRFFDGRLFDPSQSPQDYCLPLREQGDL